MTRRTNLEAQGRDVGWARDGTGRLRPLNNDQDLLCFALTNQRQPQPESERRIEREPNGRRWMVIDGKNIHGPFEDERRAYIFMKNLKGT